MFHKAVEKNDYHLVKSLYNVELNNKSYNLDDIFITNLINSKQKVRLILFYFIFLNICI
jgi:hypothetical protein